MELQLEKLTQVYVQPSLLTSETAIEIHQRKQEELDREKEAFFSAGGTVEIHPIRKYTPPPEVSKPSRSYMKSHSSLVSFDESPDKTRRVNISTSESKKGTKYQVQIGGVYYGMFETEELAIQYRDRKRNELNMERVY